MSENNPPSDAEVRDRLIVIIYDLGEQDAIGCADQAECYRQLGIPKEAFDRVVGQIIDRGYIDNKSPFESLKLSMRGLSEAERIKKSLRR